MNPYNLTFKPYGKSAILIEWPQQICEDILNDIRVFSMLIEQENIKYIIEVNYIYSSMLVVYDNLKIKFRDLASILELLYKKQTFDINFTPHFWEIPVCYDQKFGIDLMELSIEKNMSIQEIIDLHTSRFYTIYGFGFLPGFLYLGGMNAKLFSLRKNVPRLHVPKGSVGIGNEQTGIYPQDSPGGWQIIGKTPIDLFSVKNNPPSLLLAGDKIKFYNISMDDFKELEGSRLVLKYKKS